MGHMKIAVLGGAFDPPHIGHLIVASQVQELLGMDEVWLMPCYSYFPEFPVKFSRITPPEQRFAMAKMLESATLKVSDFEFVKNKRSRTVDTLRMLEKERPGDSFSWIIGSDILPTFNLWNEWQSLVRDHNLIVFPRDTDFRTLEERVMKSFHLTEIPENITVVEGDLVVSNIASTHIRKRIRAGQQIAPLVMPEVAYYIENNKLYVK